MINQQIYLFRNCYTSGKAGGDVHSNEIFKWIKKNNNNIDINWVHPAGDNQLKAYPSLKSLSEISFTTPIKSSITFINFLLRTLFSCTNLKLLKKTNSLYVASSHFIPDVLPAIFHSRGLSNNQRTVYIHHIIGDMERNLSITNVLAKMQEKICFLLIKRKFGKIIVVNNGVKQRLLELNFTKNEIFVSSNFIDHIKKNPQSIRKDLDLVFCGRLMHQKGVYDFISVFKELNNRHGSAMRAAMIGDGPEKENLQRQIKSLKLNIGLMGFVSEEKKFELLKRAKLMLFPSIEEGWGIAIAEALASNTPVLAYDLPVYKEVFNSTITTVQIKDIGLLSNVADNLLTIYKNDKNGYEKIQTHGLEYISKFDLNIVAQKQQNFILN